MNSSRPSSRNNLLNPAQQPVRRAKITVNAQMDISNVPPHAKPITIAPSATSNGTATVRGLSVANHLNTPPPRLTTRTRSSNSVLSNASYKSNSTQPGGGGYTNGTTGSGALTTGADSVVSDDSTMSEDSDRVLDDGSHSQFNGSTLGRASASVISAYRAATVPKTTGGTGRVRTTSSTVGLNNGAGGAAKSMRIAAGASIKVDPPTHQAASSGSGSVVNGNAGLQTGPPTTVPSTLSTLAPPSRAGSTVGRSWDEGSTVSVNSSVSTSHNAQQQPIIRAGKANNATGTSIAAANKLAEENRRAEEAARTRRKIADLEISNNSLLSINSSLEATVRKQAAKMQELKLRMQSAHYGDLGISAADIALAQSVDAIELTEADQQDDMIFKRLCLSIDQMVSEAKRALDQATPKSGVKVLTSYELYEKECQGEETQDKQESSNNSAAASEVRVDKAGTGADMEEGDPSLQGPITASTSTVSTTTDEKEPTRFQFQEPESTQQDLNDHNNNHSHLNAFNTVPSPLHTRVNNNDLDQPPVPYTVVV